MSLEFVRADVLRNVQSRLIERYGGLSGVRDDGALESAIARPKNLFAYGQASSVAELGASHASCKHETYSRSGARSQVGFALCSVCDR